MRHQWIKLAEMTHTVHRIIRNGFIVRTRWQQPPTHVSIESNVTRINIFRCLDLDVRKI